jgi:hypothetical protein
VHEAGIEWRDVRKAPQQDYRADRVRGKPPARDKRDAQREQHIEVRFVAQRPTRREQDPPLPLADCRYQKVAKHNEFTGEGVRRIAEVCEPGKQRYGGPEPICRQDTNRPALQKA